MHYSLKWIVKIHEPTILITLQGIHDLDLLRNLWYTQVMHDVNDVNVYTQLTN